MSADQKDIDILLIQDSKGRWTIPKGHIEPGETARQTAIYVVREITGMSMEDIGREFSGRDHSTIVYSLKAMEQNLENDHRLKETVEDIIKNVRA